MFSSSWFRKRGNYKFEASLGLVHQTQVSAMRSNSNVVSALYNTFVLQLQKLHIWLSSWHRLWNHSHARFSVDCSQASSNMSFANLNRWIGCFEPLFEGTLHLKFAHVHGFEQRTVSFQLTTTMHTLTPCKNRPLVLHENVSAPSFSFPNFWHNKKMYNYKRWFTVPRTIRQKVKQEFEPFGLTWLLLLSCNFQISTNLGQFHLMRLTVWLN